MTAGCTLSDGTRTVDFVQSFSATSTANIVSIVTRLSNPTTTLSTPAVAGDSVGSNTIVVNLKMTRISFDLYFQFKDGVGTFDGVTPGSTNYEKLLYMANFVGNPKTLTLNGTAFKVQIDSMNIPYDAGKGNLILNGSISMTTCADISMG